MVADPAAKGKAGAAGGCLHQMRERRRRPQLSA